MEARAQIAQEMAELAIDFLSSLDTAQEKLAAWPFPSDGERERWFYTPTDHGGVTLGSLTSPQERKALRFVASGLSVAGYVTLATIIGLDNILDQVEGWKINWGRDRGRDPGLYYLRVFGTPGNTGSWSWRFGGHHVSIQHTIIDGMIVASTPCFFGADPASSPLLGSAPLRPLAGPEDLAHDVVLSLTDEQLHRALLSPNAPTDLVTTNRRSSKRARPPSISSTSGAMSSTANYWISLTPFRSMPTKRPALLQPTSLLSLILSSPRGYSLRTLTVTSAKRFVSCSTHTCTEFLMRSLSWRPQSTRVTRLMILPSPGRALRNRGNPTTTACRLRNYSLNMTTPSGLRTTSTPCGVTPIMTSAAIFWLSTSRTTTKHRNPARKSGTAVTDLVVFTTF